MIKKNTKKTIKKNLLFNTCGQLAALPNSFYNKAVPERSIHSYRNMMPQTATTHKAAG
jgi:hypothetical protein